MATSTVTSLFSSSNTKLLILNKSIIPQLLIFSTKPTLFHKIRTSSSSCYRPNNSGGSLLGRWRLGYCSSTPPDYQPNTTPPEFPQEDPEPVYNPSDVPPEVEEPFPSTAPEIEPTTVPDEIPGRTEPGPDFPGLPIPPSPPGPGPDFPGLPIPPPTGPDILPPPPDGLPPPDPRVPPVPPPQVPPPPLDPPPPGPTILV